MSIQLSLLPNSGDLQHPEKIPAISGDLQHRRKDINKFWRLTTSRTATS